MLGHPGAIAADELPQLAVAADLARAGIVDHHLARPRRLQGAAVTGVQRGEELPDRVRVTRVAGLPARQLHRTDELREPGHNSVPWAEGKRGARFSARAAAPSRTSGPMKQSIS